MSYAGTVLDAIKKMKANSALRTSRRKAYKNKLNGTSYEITPFKLKETTLAEKQAVREKITSEISKDINRAMNILLIGIILFIIFMKYFVVI